MAITPDTKLDPSIPHRLAVDVDAAEGDRLEAYPDSLGFWTIGRGHELPPAAPGHSWKGFTIIQSTSDLKFNADLLSAMAFAQKLPEFPSCDTECRQNALYELCFNMRGKWDGFHKARAAIEAKDWKTVHDELLNSLWAEEVHDRAKRLAQYFLIGQYPS